MYLRFDNQVNRNNLTANSKKKVPTASVTDTNFRALHYTECGKSRG